MKPHDIVANPVRQEQPCPVSCWPTCLAMAIGVPVADVLDTAERHGCWRKGQGRGMDESDAIWLAMQYGIGLHYIANMHGLGGLAHTGSYILVVPSLNKPGTTHAVLHHQPFNEHDRKVLLDPSRGDLYELGKVRWLYGWHLDDFKRQRQRSP